MVLLFWNLCVLGENVMGMFCFVFFLSCPEKEHKEWCNELHESEKRGREMETAIFVPYFGMFGKLIIV